MATSNLMGTTLTSTDGNANGIGFYITPNKDCKIVAVVKSATCNATNAYIYNSSKTQVASASFSGNTATFSYDVTNGTNYYVISLGHSTRHYGTAGSYPRNRTDLTYTNNAYMTSAGNSPSSLVTGIGEDANITDIQTEAGTAYTLALALGAYTYTGVSTSLLKALNIALALGTYTYTGIATAFSVGKGIIISAGSYVYTGFDTTFTKALTVVLALGTYAYTGFATGLTRAMTLIAGVGSYVYTGFNVVFRKIGWDKASKSNTTSWSNRSKSNTSSWTNQTK